jgi:hypothetical protein
MEEFVGVTVAVVVRWIAAHRRALAMMLLASLAGLVAGVAVAPGGTKTRAASQTIIVRGMSTVVQTRTITKPSHVVTRTSTETAPATAPVTVGPPAAQASQGAGAKQHFAGSRPRNLGNITVASPATLRWTSTGKRFQLLFDGGLQAIDSTSHAGQTFVPAQTYFQVRVQTDGDWTMRIG